MNKYIVLFFVLYSVSGCKVLTDSDHRVSGSGTGNPGDSAHIEFPFLGTSFIEPLIERYCELTFTCTGISQGICFDAQMQDESFLKLINLEDYSTPQELYEAEVNSDVIINTNMASKCLESVELSTCNEGIIIDIEICENVYDMADGSKQEKF